jgi:acyl carrier protein
VTTVRDLLVQLLDDPSVAALPDDTPLFKGGLGLSSLDGAALLRAIDEELGVDVAAEDIALESLETVGTLSRFVAVRLAR